MVEFGSGFYMPMDREYARPSNDSTNDVNIGIGEIGTSVGLGPVPNIPALSAKLRSGIKNVELGFMGQGKGSGQGHTPGMYGKMQRQALREMQKANRVDFTTHATVGVYGVAGMDQQGNFSKESKNFSLSEIKRAIDFASDVAGGGPVVVHTGEFRRPLSEADWNKDGDYAQKFKAYSDEEKNAVFRVVDTRTGGVIQPVQKGRKIARPVWNTVDEGQEYFEEGVAKIAQKGEKVYVDYYGNRVTSEHRVPKFNKEKQEFEVRQLGWDDLIEEAGEMRQRAIEEWKKWKSGEVTDKDFKDGKWARFADVKSEEEIKIKPEEAYIISHLETQAANSRGWAYYYSANFDETVQDIKKLEKARELYEKIEEATSEDEKWKLQKEVQKLAFVPPEYKMPTEYIDMQIRERRRGLKQTQEGASSQWSQAKEMEETIKHVESADTYALREAFDSYADAGIYAMMHTEKLKREKSLKKPVAIAMENLFPENYGAHPDELKFLVKGGRERMKELLMQRGMNEEEAKAKAKEHLVATFDTGHLNMWRKYWQGDPNKTLEENDKDFDKWMLKKVEELAKDGIVGHLHVVDNYGYQDDHLAPGEGNTPITEIMKIFKKHGYKGKIIIEPGADFTTDTGGFASVTKAWKLFGSPVYGTPGVSPEQKTWGQVGNGYFGMTQPPYFTFGSYVPSEDWTLWSGVPLE